MQDVTKTTEQLPQEHATVPDEPGWGVATVRYLWAKRRFLSRASIAGLVLGTLVAFLTPKQYQSSARLMPPDITAGGSLSTLTTMASMTEAATQALDMLPMKSTGALFIGILRSRTVQDRLIGRFDLKKVYGSNLMVDTRAKLEENTEVTEDRRAGIIIVTVTDRSPQRSAAMARAYVEELDRLVTELNTSAAHRERVFIEGQLKQVKQDLDEAARQLSEFSSKNATFDVKDQTRAMVDAAATLQAQFIVNESELRALQQIYTGENVRVRAASARVAELRSQLQKLGGKGSKAVSNPSQADGLLYPSLRELPLLGFTYMDLYRRSQIQETVYEALTKQYELAKVQEAKETPSVRVLDSPEVPERKMAPRRLMIMFVSTMLGFAFAVAWVVGSSAWTRVDPQDPTRQLLQEIASAVKPHIAFWKGNGFSRYVLSAQHWKRAQADPHKEGEPPSQQN
jgi:capsule polysaccharide export protein KpsE/RkpR